MASGFVVHAGEGDAAPGAGGRVLATTAATDGAFTLLLSYAPAGDGAPLHVHRDESESFFVLAGTTATACSSPSDRHSVGDVLRRASQLASTRS